MTKNQLVDKLRERSELQKKDIALLIDNFLEEILQAVNKGEKVELRGFGTFSRTQKKARKIFSPIANKMVDVLPRSILVFKASKTTEKEITGG